jgi:hypothetical protein
VVLAVRLVRELALWKELEWEQVMEQVWDEELALESECQLAKG